MRTGLLGWKDKSVLLVFAVILLASIAAVLLYDQKTRAAYIDERMYDYEQRHEKAYSSMYLYTEQLQALYRQLLLGRELNAWLSNPGELTQDMYGLSQIQGSFFDLINSHAGIASIYLHNRKTDVVLSTHDMLAELAQFPRHAVFDALYAREQPYLWQVSGSEDAPRISAVAAIGKRGAVAIQIDAAYLQEQVLGGSPHVLWLDEHEQVLLAGDPGLRAYYGAHRRELLDVQQTSYMLGDYFVIRSSSSSPARKWQLLTLVPRGELLPAAARQAPYTYTILGLCAAMGVLMFVYFRYIRRGQEQLSAVRFRRHLEDSRSALIADLLHGKHSVEQLRETAAQYEVELSARGYQVLVFQIDNYYNYLLAKSSSERFLTNKQIYSAIKWTFALRYNAYAINTEPEKVAVLLCHDTLDEGTTGELEATIRYIQDDILANCGLTVCAGVSEVAGPLEQVHSCHVHARSALEYKAVYGKHALIHYERIAAPGDAPLQQRSEEIGRIPVYLQEGKLEAIQRCMTLALEQAMAAERFTPEWIDAVCANMMAQLMKVVIEQRIDINQACGEDVFITLYSYEFLDEKKAYMLHVCRTIVEQLESRRESAQSNTSLKLIIDYIDHHYDQPISLTMLAGELSMSPSYLSAFIKNQLGIGFLDYVIKLRLQKAMKLLENDDLTIQKIAESCGYDTVHTFIRHFKKAHHMPPNEYRMRNRMCKKSAIPES
ncbi:helix-turn-helix domain-containing protein [Paenibacillus sp. IB182496]|uniref:Helix-turn-helix domain-containing protein n=1 Tax=Paenibacillus sabuli TaxID=2772509 RepID=A0A927BQT3_9BACL|nr:AraC family transcriptional regulator [Paenibacillus sabuli]MBD2843844.1 helix-turn-helix domain-containing protein [Paenibacillus sabuli]